MNLRAFGLVSGALLTGLMSGAALFAQESPSEPQRAESTRTPEQWVKDLGSDSYRTRVAAERALRKLGKDALPALRAAAESTADAEAQWRSKRLIRQIETGGSGIEERGTDAVEPEPTLRRPDARDQFEDIFRRMERDFGIDIPLRRFQDDFFQDLDQQFRDLQQRLQGQQAQSMNRSQGMSMQVGPDGVRVEVQEQNEKGETEKKVYEAPDIATFREQYPDVLERHGLKLGDGAMGFGFTPFAPKVFDVPGLRLDGPRLTPLPGAVDALDVPLPGERLGVRVRPEVPAAVREYLGLDAGVGLMIESVQDDTLAQRLGLRAGDIVTAVGGQAIGSPADVRQALGAIDAGKPVTVKFLRKGVEQSAQAEKPAAESAESAKPAEGGKPTPGVGIEPRRGSSKIR